MVDEDIDRVLELEHELQLKALRADPDRLRTLLAPEFREIDASGRVRDREATIDHLQTEEPDVLEIGVGKPSVRRVSGDLILVTWVSERWSPGLAHDAGRRVHEKTNARFNDAQPCCCFASDHAPAGLGSRV
ncbi:DUF4440 domain-containing protein [Mycobacterium sp. 050128]|uniref:DUF4440 domain-containing protein n=1 Tax=Mycobacterium sp. 050128 TaxID=3096112 RepID=UPI003FA55AF0